MTTDGVDALLVFIVKILTPDEPSAKEAEVVEEKRREGRGLIAWEIWEIVKEENMPDDANIVDGRIVLELKNFLTPKDMAKVRYIAQGFDDAPKNMLTNDVSDLGKTSIRLLLCIDAMRALRLFSHDVTQAYLQAKKMLIRVVYVRHKPGDRHLFGVAEDELLKLLKLPYSQCDSDDYWNITVDEHLVKHLGMGQAVSDVSLYFQFDG